MTEKEYILKENFETPIAKYQKRVADNEPIENIVISLHEETFVGFCY